MKFSGLLPSITLLALLATNVSALPAADITEKLSARTVSCAETEKECGGTICCPSNATCRYDQNKYSCFVPGRSGGDGNGGGGGDNGDGTFEQPGCNWKRGSGRPPISPWLCH